MATTDPGTTDELARRMVEWIDRLLPDAARAERLTAALLDGFAGDSRPVTEAVSREIEAVAQRHSRHLALEFLPAADLVPDRHAPGWPPHRADVARRAGSVTDVRRGRDGVGILVLDGLDPVGLAAPYLEAAFALLRGVTGLILDLRANGGGDPGTLTLVLDWLLDDAPAHVSDVVYKDRTRQWWTTGRMGDRALPREVPVAVLVGGRTFSSGEALAYHIQSRGRGRLVGAPTPGAADHVTPLRLTASVRGLIPEAYVRDAKTGANWEGAGVIPDVPCDEDEALERALVK